MTRTSAPNPARFWKMLGTVFLAVGIIGLIVAIGRLHQPELCPLISLYVGIGGPLLAAGLCYFTALTIQQKQAGADDMQHST